MSNHRGFNPMAYRSAGRVDITIGEPSATAEDDEKNQPTHLGCATA